MEIDVSKNPLQNAGSRLSDILKECAGAPSLLLLPGGSALSVLNFVDLGALRPNLTVGFGDERYTTEPDGLNIDAAQKSEFFRKALAAGCTVIDPRTFIGRGVEKAGADMARALRSWRKKNPAGKIILLGGFGPDGHTFAIVPLPDRKKFDGLFNDEKIPAVGHAVGTKGWPERFTITLPFIRTADYAVIYGVGADKGDAVKAILADSGSLFQTPARIFRELKNAALCTDQTP